MDNASSFGDEVPLSVVKMTINNDYLSQMDSDIGDDVPLSLVKKTIHDDNLNKVDIDIETEDDANTKAQSGEEKSNLISNESKRKKSDPQSKEQKNHYLNSLEYGETSETHRSINDKQTNQQNRNDPKTEKQKYQRKVEAFSWICTACREAESAIDPESPLLLCEGPCGRPFHYPCAGLNSVPPEDQIWMCTDCIQKRHHCSACGQFGDVDVDVFKCEKKSCGLFFHESCLSLYNVDVKLVVAEDGETKPRFRCPAHECWTCSEGVPIMHDPTGKERKKKLKSSDAKSFSQKNGELFRCLDCPIAYHASCIPPKARFHELALLCHEHAYSSKLPDLDLKHSVQAEVEADVDKKIKKIRQSRGYQESKNNSSMRDQISCLNSFLPLFCPPIDKETVVKKVNNVFNQSYDSYNFYRLPDDFREVVHAKPSSYTHIHSLRYDPASRPKRKPPNENGVCNCKPVPPDFDKVACGENCLNAVIMIECVGDSTSKKTNPYTNCNCGPTCGNRKVSRREVAKARPKRENGKGWGLMAMEDVKKGKLVQEYVGEVINEKKMIERLNAWSIDQPHDTNFYIMQLEQGWFIDAREKGNLSRFINHSCDPNCKLVPVNVNGFMRVAVMSIRDIEAGEFFSYDYQFDTKHGDRFICKCGADNCRGTMKGGPNQGTATSVKKSVAQMIDEGKARLERDTKFLEQSAKEEISRLNTVGLLVPGEPVDGSNTVASGPQEKDKDYVRNHHIFLWRNVQIGADFNSRHWRIIKKRRKQKRTIQCKVQQKNEKEPI